MLVEGIIFLAITFLNIRDKILECIPKNLRFAISAGIGMFIAIIISTLIGIPMGVTQFSDNWMPVSTPHSIAPIFCQFDFTGFFTPKMFMVVFSLLLVNIFDTIGTVLGLVSKLGIKENEKGDIPGVKEAMMSDAIGTTAGALLGSSTITTYVESASGVAEGGKSGLTSFFTGLMFILSIFLLFNYAFG